MAMRSTRDSEVGASQRAIGPDSGGPFTVCAGRSPISDIGGRLLTGDLSGELAIRGRSLG